MSAEFSDELHAFEPIFAEALLTWVGSFQETFFWSARKQFPLDPHVFEQWHLDPDIHPYLLVQDEEAIAYGEISLQTDTGEAELMRLLVHPEWRGQGVAGRLIRALLKLLEPDSVKEVLARINPQSEASRRCLEKAGFVRLALERENELNQWDSQPFEWFCYTLPSSV
jgi:RimJ/RimL family protein N-acetyltransferase